MLTSIESLFPDDILVHTMMPLLLSSEEKLSFTDRPAKADDAFAFTILT